MIFGTVPLYSLSDLVDNSYLGKEKFVQPGFKEKKVSNCFGLLIYEKKVCETTRPICLPSSIAKMYLDTNCVQDDLGDVVAFSDADDQLLHVGIVRGDELFHQPGRGRVFSSGSYSNIVSKVPHLHIKRFVESNSDYSWFDQAYAQYVVENSF